MISENPYHQMMKDGDEMVEHEKNSMIKWARFMAMPCTVSPCRMPSLWPIASHLPRRRNVFEMAIGPGGYNSCLWAPEHYNSLGYFFATAQTNASASNLPLSRGNLSRIFQASELIPRTPGGDPEETLNVDHIHFQRPNLLSADISQGGSRLIAACLNITYLGRVDDISGIIEVGMHANTGISPTLNNDSEIADTVSFATSSEITQAPYYHKERISEGTRLIWFPLDSSKFDFRVPQYTLQGGNNLAGTIQNGATGTTINENGDPIGGVGVITTNDYGFHLTQRPEVRLEWFINFTGVQTIVPIRVHIEYFYETIPDERFHDDYLPVKGPSGDPHDAVKYARKVAYNVGVTPSRASSRFNASGILSKIDDYLGIAKKAYSVAKTVAPFITPAISLAKGSF